MHSVRALREELPRRRDIEGRGREGVLNIIDQVKCIKCGNCLVVCPPKARAVSKVDSIDLAAGAKKAPAGKKGGKKK